MTATTRPSTDPSARAAPRPGAPPSPTTPDVAAGATPRLGAEVALALVSLATVAGFARLYSSFSFFWPLAGFAVGGHILAAACRHRRVSPATALVVAVVGGSVLVGWLLFPATTVATLPTLRTWTAAGHALDQATNRFGQVVAPAPVLPGFQLALALAVWAAVWFADWSAFRLWATVESVAPCAVLFVFGALLGAPSHRAAAAAVFIGAVLVFVLLHRTAREESSRTWVAATPSGGRRALLRAGAAASALAVLGGAALGPHLPGAGSKPLVAWRQTQAGDTSRITVSPLVDIRKRLVDQSATAAFDVQSDRPAYWRLTSLDSFDGQIWSSSGAFSRAGAHLPRQGPLPPVTRRVTQTFQIRNLSAIWVPAAFEARQLTDDGSNRLRWDATSSTLIVDNDRRTSDGLSYRTVSQAPAFTPAELRLPRGTVPAAIRQRYLRLPKNLALEARRAAGSVTASAADPYDKALALQQWFRTQFTYDITVTPGHGEDAITAFLADRRGYCEQFAGTFAAMARVVGLPSRVAVGFTPGDSDPTIPGLYHVKGKHAHAWPEVYFAGMGWVPFEPTPGRGAPDAEAWTGVPPQQDTSLEPHTSTIPATIAPAPTLPPRAGANPTDERRLRTRTQPATTRPGGPSAVGRVLTGTLAAAAALAAGWLLTVLLVPMIRRRRRRSAATTPAGQVGAAWEEALEPVEWLTGDRPHRWESHAEFSARAAPALGRLGAPHRELAGLAAAASWAALDPGPDAAQRADELASTVRHGAHEQVSARKRLQYRLSLRRAFGRAARAPRPGPSRRRAGLSELRRRLLG